MHSEDSGGKEKGTWRATSVQSAYIMRRHTHLPSKKGNESETNMKSAKAESSTNKTDSKERFGELYWPARRRGLGGNQGRSRLGKQIQKTCDSFDLR